MASETMAAVAVVVTVMAAAVRVMKVPLVEDSTWMGRPRNDKRCV